MRRYWRGALRSVWGKFILQKLSDRNPLKCIHVCLQPYYVNVPQIVEACRRMKHLISLIQALPVWAGRTVKNRVGRWSDRTQVTAEYKTDIESTVQRLSYTFSHSITPYTHYMSVSLLDSSVTYDLCFKRWASSSHITYSSVPELTHRSQPLLIPLIRGFAEVH